MEKELFAALETLLVQWRRNQQTHILEGAEDQATLLEHQFYLFIEVFKEWFRTIEKPADLDEGLQDSVIKCLVEKLPEPLYLPFELELDLLIDGVEQENDEKYD
ncbi:hypothetical protein [Ammoniphilus resinae]|uniref:Uncharacterized protein n=1 Tax=Ammoniphilus resinae TaxID=861532 RepID=A0ABS4GU76_9BACL|nr:hypothetical protein [Ammoniphilus resinae]MBP1933826.1 hypothetical protein [Ammoniphilus resinae]